MPVPFEDIELAPNRAAVLEMLLDGLTLDQIQNRCEIKNRTSLNTVLCRLMRDIQPALPVETTTYYHLMAREFLRGQEAILRGIRVQTADGLTEEEIDLRFQAIAEQERANEAPKTKVATA